MTFKHPSGDKLYGFYRGTVVKHLERGKCKVYIPDIYTLPENSTNPDSVPDAEQASPLGFGANGGNGVFSYPHIGAAVWCFFEGGDQNRPVYFASSLGGPECYMQNAETNEVTGSWSQARSNVGGQGSQDDTSVNGTDAQVHFIQCGNVTVTVEESGRVVMRSEKDEGSSQVTFDQNGNISLKSTTEIKIEAPRVIVNGADLLHTESNQLEVVAAQKTVMTSPKLSVVSSSSAALKSPAITLDASEGSVRAVGARHNQVLAY